MLTTEMWVGQQTKCSNTHLCSQLVLTPSVSKITLDRFYSQLHQTQDTMVVIEQNKSGFERPGDVEFEDYSQGINRTSSESSLGTPKGPMDILGRNRSKNFWLFSKKSKVRYSTLGWHVLMTGPHQERRSYFLFLHCGNCVMNASAILSIKNQRPQIWKSAGGQSERQCLVFEPQIQQEGARKSPDGPALVAHTSTLKTQLSHL